MANRSPKTGSSWLLALVAWSGPSGLVVAQEPPVERTARPVPEARRGPRPQAPPKVPEGVTAHRDLAYVRGGHARQKLDLYVPEKGDGPRPLIVWVHGGGWQAGSKDNCPPLRLGFVGRGYAVASVGYRLSGDAPFPAQIEDCKAAIRWLRAHAGEYQLDPDRIGAWGASAGGHLVALLGTTGDSDEFAVGEHRDRSGRVQAVCDFFGPSDLTAFASTPGYESHARPESPESKLLGGPVAEVADKARRASPVTYASADDPPFLLVHGSADPVVPPDQSVRMHAALEKAGVPARLHTLEGARHGGPAFESPEVRAMVDDFFDRHLKPRSAPAAAEPGAGAP